ncbi:hypothetical protein H2200_013196 [Cladophialophora chaetospira]|uniref:Mis12-Mtw1 family protein n=1 Tax=Cladophialophora chaetospira TaxID=386627 RepID=A0AA38WWC0_9EURO|nr:hypothetical protein H2200_013196 [Cladophialophora chaetospira]
MIAARPPLQNLPMSSYQRPARRLSARNQEKEDVTLYSQPQPSKNVNTTVATSATGVAQAAKSNDRKRKMNYDEEDDGFMFKRVKKKPEPKAVEHTKEAAPSQNRAQPSDEPQCDKLDAPTDDDPAPKPKTRQKRMSFSTPKPRNDPPPRRSKRLSKDNAPPEETPVKTPIRREVPTKQSERHTQPSQKESPKRPIHRKPETHRQEQGPDLQQDQVPQSPSEKRPAEKSMEQQKESVQDDHREETVPTLQDNHPATRIALPLADTPVIKRNKAMREGKTGKGERRSSLGSRGRRASSLIESGNSNAVPHSEVDVADYYKHIESEGLPEPRRMRQLLTWCAERGMDEKPTGTEFEHSSARHGARAIEEELLKDLSNKSELSDWFSREEVETLKQPLPERPNPRNVQNCEKITELEEQIRRLRIEKEALELFLRPPSLPPPPKQNSPSSINHSLLSETEAAALDSIASTSNPTSTLQVSRRVNEVLDSIGPTIDIFADGVHKIGLYRAAADNVAGRVLAMCAEKLTEREKEGRKKALAAADQTQDQGTPPKDMASVLRSLSRADR